MSLHRCLISNAGKFIFLSGLGTLVTLLAGCGGGLSGDQEPIADDFGIAYVQRPIPLEIDEDDPTIITPIPDDILEPEAFLAGADLYYREVASPSAEEFNITESVTGGMGDVKDVQVSYDGSKLLFALRLPEIEGLDEDEQPKWNIWEYVIETDTLSRVISEDTVAEEGHDVAPYYLPDGRIVFSSNRQRQSKAVLLDEGKPQFEAQDEDRQRSAFNLHVMSATGTDIHQISFNQSHELKPFVLDSGEVAFSRWDNKGARDQVSFYKMNPDGTDAYLLYGAHSHDTGTNDSTIQFINAREMPDGQLLVLPLPFTNIVYGSDMVAIDILNYIDNDQPTRFSAGLTGPAQVSISQGEVYTDGTPSPGGRFNSAFPLWDGTNRALVSWSQCRLLEMQDLVETIVPCTEERLAQPIVTEANPYYGVWIYNFDENTQLPIRLPDDGFMMTDVVAAQPRPLPTILLDKLPGEELEADWVSEGVGALHIRSVYDLDGVFNPIGSAAPDIATLADPAQTTAGQRPARFLKVVKSVSLPDRDFLDFANTAFGVSAANQMREIIGYAPIEPDGSVKVKVPANVPLAISILDANGRRLGGQHQNWFQVRAGETKECHGCHDHASGIPHGRPADGPIAVNQGAPTSGLPFPNTEPAMIAEMGETMAETRARISCDTNVCADMELSTSVKFTDVWTDPNVRAKDPDLNYLYADLMTPVPTPQSCINSWSSVCRIIINYEEFIHPLWGLSRVVEDETGNVVADNTCTSCHDAARVDASGNLIGPEAQLDLTDGASADEPDHFNAYRELLTTDNVQEVVDGQLVDVLVEARDGNGDLIFETDDQGNLILNEFGDPIPVLVAVTVGPSMSPAGANVGVFLSLFDVGGSHEGRLSPAEMRLIAEWLDIGAQYYNNPFEAPLN